MSSPPYSSKFPVPSVYLDGIVSLPHNILKVCMYVYVCFSGNAWKAGFVSNTDHRLLDVHHRAGMEQILINIGWTEVKFCLFKKFFLLK